MLLHLYVESKSHDGVWYDVVKQRAAVAALKKHSGSDSERVSYFDSFQEFKRNNRYIEISPCHWQR